MAGSITFDSTLLASERRLSAFYGGGAGLRVVINYPRLPGTLLLATSFTSACIALAGALQIQGLVELVSTSGVGTMLVATVAVRVLSYLFAVLMGAYYVWQRSPEWALAALLGGSRAYVVASTFAEVAIRALIAAASALVITVLSSSLIGWAVGYIYSVSVPMPIVEVALHLGLVAILVTGVATVAALVSYSPLRTQTKRRP